MIGKYVIGYYLAQSSIVTVYGAAASIMIIMVWIYYNAIILYFGAEFTQVYTESIGGVILPKKYAVLIEKKAIDTEKLLPKNYAASIMVIIAAVITTADPTSKLPSFSKLLHRDFKKQNAYRSLCAEF